MLFHIFIKNNVYCNPMKQSDRIVVCKIGNPLVANGNVNFEFYNLKKIIFKNF